MKPGALQVVDPRRTLEIIEELLARRPGYVPEWVPPDAGPERALIRIYARYLEAVLERLNQVPKKSLLAFLELLGVELIPAQAARAPIVFRLGDKAPDAPLPAGSRVAAPPPPESSEQIVFETERAIGLSAARLAQVVSLWPGRDQSIDHTAAFRAGQVIRPFRRAQLEDTPHVLYIAHDTLLALAGKVRLDVELDLTQVSSERLATAWAYWDGKVWREFARQRTECGETGVIPPDGTAGFTRSGKVRLETDCAETKKTAVNGVEGFWIRARLDEPLPLVPDQILPEVSRVGLTSVIERDLKVILTSFKAGYPQSSSAEIECVLADTNGQPVVGAAVELVGKGVLRVTDGTGQVRLPIPPTENVEYTLAISAFGTRFTRAVLFAPPDGAHRLLKLEMALEVDGLQPDPAFADAQKVDLSRPFYPFGQQPEPGSTFYFSAEEAFTKPGARLSVHVQKTDTPQDQAAVSGSGTPPVPLEHRVSWEYWNGQRWAQFLFYSNSGATSTDPKPSPRDFTGDGVVEIVVPEDMAPVEVNDKNGLWMRVRVLGGAFGFTQKVTWKDASNKDNAFTFVVAKPPALSDFRLSYVWEYGPFPPERVLAFNDFRYTDRTIQAKWPGEPFPPFQQIADATPALHLGFDKKLPVDRVSLFFDIVERPGGGAAPALVWEDWNGFRWRPVGVEDETRDLRYPGTVSLIGPEDSRPVARFGSELHWLRARLAEDGPPAEPEIRGIHLNAALAAQRQTIVQENLGSSNGRPGQVFAFRRIPVLAGELLEVREVAGPRANVEWRILALEVLGGGQRTVREIEALLGREGLLTDVERGDLRLRRDRDKRVTEVWVRWHPRRHLLGSRTGDRHYVLEQATGRVAFGDGEHGKVPPLGAQLLAREYRSGGGASGNVAARAIKSLLSGVAGVEAVFNPVPAEGGADAETAAALLRRGPRTVRHRGRAISAGDFETMAQEASPAVAVARALPALDSEGRTRPGWITLVVIPKSEEPRPQPSFGLREQVRQSIERRAAAELAAGLRLHLTGPAYRLIDVEATIAPLDPAAAGEVGKAARRALEGFLHPLAGGPEGAGWEPGRHVFLSDVAAVLERVPGVDYVRDLALLLDGAPQGESARVAAGVIAAAGEIRIQLSLEVCR